MYVDIAVNGDKSQIEELAGQAVLRVRWLLNGLPYYVVVFFTATTGKEKPKSKKIQAPYTTGIKV